MAINEIIKKMILKNNELFKSTGALEVAVFKSDKSGGSCCMSCKSDDDLVWTSSRMVCPYDREQFMFRDWSKVNSILLLFQEDFDIKIDEKVDVENNLYFPNIIRFISPSVKVKHYLMSNKFLEIDENKSQFGRKKFSMEGIHESNFSIDKELVRQIAKSVSIINEKTFRIKIDNGVPYALIGEENRSVDNIKIKVGDSINVNFEITKNFSFEYFNSILKIFEKLDGQSYMKIFEDKIVFSNYDGDIETTTLIRGRD